MLDDRGARMIDNPNNEVRSAIDIFVKDMGLVTAAARANTYPAPLASAAEQLYLAGRRAGLGRADDSSLIEVLRGAAPRPDAPHQKICEPTRSRFRHPRYLLRSS